MIAVLITTPQKEAKRIVKILLDQKLCACSNIINGVESFFLWQGKIDTAQESLIIAKTTQALFERLKKKVIEVHPYEVPEIVGFELSKVSKSYQDWLNKELNL